MREAHKNRKTAGDGGNQLKKVVSGENFGRCFSHEVSAASFFSTAV